LASRTISEEGVTIFNLTLNYCGTIILLELLLEVKLDEVLNFVGNEIAGKTETSSRIWPIMLSFVLQIRPHLLAIQA
jgi:hypothetical protein